MVELPEDTVTLCLMGDLMCLAGQQYTAARRDGSHDYSDSFGMILEILSQCDFVIANLETTLSESNPYSTAERLVNDQPNCNAPADYLGSLRQAGITHLVTANNHSLDGGIVGVEETIAHLEEYGIPHIGTYRMDNTGKRYLLLEKNGIRIALLAFTELINQRDTVAAEQLSRIIDCYSSRTAADRIAAARADGADFVIVYNHWGSENTHEVRAYQRKHAQELADAGADLIIGSHPHCLQEQEELTASNGRKVPCFYSLGNVVSSMTRDINHDTVLVLLTLQRGDLRQEVDSPADPSEEPAASCAGDETAPTEMAAASCAEAAFFPGVHRDLDQDQAPTAAVSIRGLELVPCHVLQSLEGKYRVITPTDYLPADKKAAAELAAAGERISMIFPQYELYVGP
ncbi:MAG: CapA family protein [Lachnospiraceae bacterium]|nr:CapA family protein [Lachnospiraceae bacterium]